MVEQTGSSGAGNPGPAPGRLSGRVAVVTGAGRGIGAAIAARLAADGAAVLIGDVDIGPATEVAEHLRGLGARALALAADITDPAQAGRLMEAAAENWGQLDILVNNAGITRDAMIHRMTDAQYNLVMDVVLRGAFNCIRAAAPWLRDAGKADREAGRRYHRKVVNIASVAGIYGTVGNCNYSAAKAGVIGLTRSLAREWAPFAVNVNAIAPGVVDTRLTAVRSGEAGTRLGMPAEARDRIIAQIPLGRIGQPEDVAGAVAFFCGPDSDWITGQVLEVHGGLEFMTVTA